MVLTEENARAEMDKAVANLPDYPGDFTGRGIVIPGGGVRYFTCAWVCIRRLRDLGCTLPIELWYMGPKEMTPTMCALLASWGVTCVDAFDVAKAQEFRRPGGFELKAFALIHCRFEHVLLLDADNVPVFDPSFLFGTPEYAATGALFWPDYSSLRPERSIWRLTGVAYRDEPEFESGQIIVDKQRCWEPLALSLWMNQHSDFWYRHIYGDKDTFHMAWRKLGRAYAMPSTPCRSLHRIMCQHDFAGRRIFQHRNFDKWTLDDPNPRIEGFIGEQACLAHLEELRSVWVDRPRRDFELSAASAPLVEVARDLCAAKWMYRLLGHEERPMRFAIDGRVSEGSATHERGWNLEMRHYGPVLALYGKAGLTCLLSRRDGRWVGRWNIGDGFLIELVRDHEIELSSVNT